MLVLHFYDSHWNFSIHRGCVYEWRCQIVKKCDSRKCTMRINSLLVIRPKYVLVWEKKITNSWHFALFAVLDLLSLFLNISLSVNSELVCRFIQKLSLNYVCFSEGAMPCSSFKSQKCALPFLKVKNVPCLF